MRSPIIPPADLDWGHASSTRARNAPPEARMKTIDKLIDKVIAPPGKKISLDDYDPGFTGGLDKKKAQALLQRGVEELAAEQDKLYAQNTYGALILFQAMDAAGKDGTIKHVMSGINPQGCQVWSFKAPSAEERDHDYLWRSMKALPERGRIGIHNRSYYEEVLVARVHREILESQQLPEGKKKEKDIWQERYDQIRAFERYLVDNGILVIKFFLNVSKKEQKKRFMERIDNPEKNWKFSATDARERAHWKEYMKAYEDAFTNTSTKWAPWYIIPADNKWFMRLAVAAIVYKTMKDLKLKYPDVTEAQKKSLAEAKQILMAEKD
jgi:PPK2 family polyphosphate:nucleotide phosphotransferase